jgi:hypothetical protein
MDGLDNVQPALRKHALRGSLKPPFLLKLLIIKSLGEFSPKVGHVSNNVSNPPLAIMKRPDNGAQMCLAR